MPRTITIDNAHVLQVRLFKDLNGDVHLQCEYNLKAGSQVVLARHADVTQWLSAEQWAAALALFDGISQNVASAEVA